MVNKSILKSNHCFCSPVHMSMPSLAIPYLKHSTEFHFINITWKKLYIWENTENMFKGLFNIL